MVKIGHTGPGTRADCGTPFVTHHTHGAELKVTAPYICAKLVTRTLHPRHYATVVQ